MAPLLLIRPAALGESTFTKGRAGNSGAADGAGDRPVFTSLPPPGIGQRVLHDGAEPLEGMRAHQEPTVDQEARGAPDPQLTGLRDVGVDPRRELVAVQAAGERARVDPEGGGVADQFRAVEGRLGGVEAIVVGPVLASGAGAARGLVRRPRPVVTGQRQVLVDEADPAAVLPQERVQRPLDPAAVRSLVVGELDDRDRRAGRPLDHGGVEGDLDLGPGGRGRRQHQERGEGGSEAGGAAQAARPSSESAVMM